ncbi:MAG TPA: hypothetical protein VK971_08215 [Thiohalobacter sp.]|nr:hypothetical protein [Thiohalobacter sp.]
MNMHPGAAPLPPNSPEPLRPPQARPAQESARPVQPAQRGEAASEQSQQHGTAQGPRTDRPEGTRGGMLDVFA